jgi:hypothetical protein
MKPSKLLLTLLSVATIGLSSTALMADGEGDQLRERMRDHMNFEITPELQKMIDAFRAERETIMAEWRAKVSEHREAMVPLWDALRAANALGENDPDAIAAKAAAIESAKKNIQEAHVAFRAANGQDLREARETFKIARRAFREQMREQLPPVEDPEG